MTLFSFKRKKNLPAPQTCAASERGVLSAAPGEYDSLAQTRLYKSLRENVPVIDAAIGKLIRLIGDFELLGADDACTAALKDFADTVQVGAAGRGLRQFVYSYLDQLLTYGAAVGEIVPTADGAAVAALYNAPLEAVELRMGDSPLDVRVLRRGVGADREAKHPERIIYTLLNPDPGTLHGNSILSGLPFVSDLMMKILTSVGQNFERAGNVRFAVTYHPPAGASAVNSRQRVEEISREWSRAMRDSKRVCDFVSVGDVSIKAIGADSQILDCDVPLRHILEQIVAKLSIPPFLLGFSWSTTERMSAQQADILTSELEYYRGLLTPVIEWICACWLRMTRRNPRLSVQWDHITLQDETELASARLDNARAAEIESRLTGGNA